MFAKKLRVNNKVSDFIKPASVFNEWRDDTKRDNAIALGHDMQYWKLYKITDDL